jgi:hypothetical protein
VVRASRNATLLVAVAALGAGLPAGAASTAAQAAHTRAPADTVFPGSLDGVSADSATDAWAAGTQCTSSCTHPATLTLHWNGTAWAKVASPDPGPTGTILAGVSAVSPTDAWAVGYYPNSTCGLAVTLILHWNGTAWSRVKSPDPGAACNWLSGVSAVSATDAWAAGQSCKFAVNTCQSLIVHWNGTAWSKVPSPTPGSGKFAPLAAVSADSPADAWAVGLYCPTASCSTEKTLTLHWNGSAWSKLPSPNPASGNYSLRGDSAGSPADAWAVGSYCTTSTCATMETLTLHWNGTAWSKVASPNPGPVRDELSGVTTLSPAGAWAVGDYCHPMLCTFRSTLILHWNGASWSRVPGPDPGPVNSLSAVAATASDNAWAVGYTCASTCGPGADALILHWNGTAWSAASG